MAAVKQRFDAWWRRDLHEGPLICFNTILDSPSEPLEEVKKLEEPSQLYLDIDWHLARFKNFLRTREFSADSYPSFDINLGPGSLALYLGSEPIFAWDTLWYKDVVKNWRDCTLAYNPDNRWWRAHFEMLKKAQDELGGEGYVNIPDIIENMDIISAMRGPQPTCFDLMDDYDIVKTRLKELDELYFKYYDAVYDLVKDADGGSSYTAFKVMGLGKTAKVQCDFCALMSPEHFRDLVKPALEYQCGRLRNSMYHLDGKDCIKHLPALMEIERLDALQWTPGSGQPDGADPHWFPIYDAVADADKSIWVGTYASDADGVINNVKRLVARYGSKRLYVLLPDYKKDDAKKILAAIAKGFK